jgi:hypothetical protein
LAAERGARTRPVRVVPDPEKPAVLLEREARGRLPAAIAAALGAVLSFAGFIMLSVAAKDRPDDDRGKLLHFHDHATGMYVGTALLSVGVLASGFALLFLYNATKGRRPETISAARITTIAGPVVFAISQVGLQIALLPKASDYAKDYPEGGKAAVAAAKDVLDQSALQVFATLTLAAQIALGFAFVLISLNAMRAGLLTRFVGILGVLVGVLFVLPLLPSPIIMSFWLLAIALLFIGRAPGGVPPAWTSGKAVPWPSQQQMREDAIARKAIKRGEEPPEPATPPPASAEPATSNGANGASGASGAPSPDATPGPQKRKRKRKR